MTSRFILLLFFLNIIVGCKNEKEQFIESENSIDIFGQIGPSLKHNGKYYCIFRNYNDQYNTLFTSVFYILSDKGKVEDKIELPEAIQTFYYDLYIKNDSIFITEYDKTFFLDLETKTWKKTKEGKDLFYKDDDF